ncbi:MAG TPA: flagellar hook-basal body protein [Bacillales bacterium]|nr:flagellar hook-basal body protein [Bacillales bacterium]
MFRGFYAAASGMLTQMRREEMLTNNLANVNTPGFKADRAAIRAFPQMLIERMGGDALPGRTPIGSVATGVYVQETIPLFRQGDLKDTGNATDVALLQGQVPDEAGALFFAVRNAEGEPRYTRNGNFSVDGLGRIVDNHGDFVLGTDGNTITVNDGQFKIDSDGTVVDNGRVVGRLQVAYAADAYGLVKEGNGLYRNASGQALPSVVGNGEIRYQLKQGFLETSNVDVQKAMVELMEAFRNLQANQQVLKAYDKTMGLAVNKVGSLN